MIHKKLSITSVVTAFFLAFSVTGAEAFCDSAFSNRFPITTLDNFSDPFLINGTIGVDFGDGPQFVWSNATSDFLCFTDSTDYAAYFGDTKIPTFIDEGNGTNFGTTEDNLMVWWNMDCNSTGVCRDLSIYDNFGTNSTANQENVAGLVGSGMNFTSTGANDYITSDSAVSFAAGTDSFTAEAWFIFPDWATSFVAAEKLIISGRTGATTYAYQIFCGATRCAFQMFDGANVRSAGNTSNIAADEWHQIVLQHTPANSSLFIDGIYVSSATGTITDSTATGVGFAVGGTGYNTLQQIHNTIVDEVRIYNRSLSADEINASYNNLIIEYSTLGASESGARPEYTNITVTPASSQVYPVSAIAFTINWTDINDTINESWLEHNFTGTFQNEFMTNVTDIHNLTIDTPTAGSYSYKFHANNSNGFLNATAFFIYDINRSSNANFTLTASPSFTESEDTEVTVTCAVDAGLTPILKRRGITVSNPNIVTLGFGNYLYNCTITDTINYTTVSSSNTLVISSAGFGCTDNTTFAFELNVTTGGVPNVTLNFTSQVNDNLVAGDLGDVFPITNNTPRGWVNATGDVFVLNATGLSSVLVRFGNQANDFGWATVTNLTAVTSFTESEINPYMKLTFVDERSGMVQLPPDANHTLSVICDSGITDINITSSRMLIATFELANEIKPQVRYSATELYFRNHIITSAVEVMNVYLVDANIHQVVELLMLLSDATGEFSDSLFQVTKFIGGFERTITELFFDTENKAIVYLINGDNYNLFVDNGVEVRSIGFLQVDSINLEKTIKLGQILASNQTEGNISFGLFNTTNTIVFSYIDASGQTFNSSMSVFNATSGTLLFTASSLNRSSVQFTYMVPDTNQTYNVEVRVHHNIFGLNTMELNVPFFGPSFTFIHPLAFFDSMVGDIPGGISWQNLVGMVAVISIAMIFTVTTGALAGIVAVVAAGVLAFFGWWAVDVIILVVAMALAFLNKLTEKKRES